MAFDNLQQQETRTAREQLDRVLFFVRRALRHWGKAGLIIGLGGILAVGGALMAKRRYRSESVLLYREVIDSSYVQGSVGRRTSTRDLGIRLRELVLSRPQLKRLLDEYNLLPDVRERQSDIEAEDKLRRLISIQFGGGDTFHISYIAPSAELAQKVTARLAQIMIEEEKRLRVQKAQQTVKFLEVERNRAHGEMNKRETVRAQFLVKHPEFAADVNRSAGTAIRVSLPKPGVSGSSALDTLKRQLSRIRNQLARAEGRKPVIVRDPKLMALKAQADAELQAAKAHLRSQRAQYTDVYPSVVKAKKRVRMAKDRLARVVTQIKATSTVQPPLNSQAKQALRNRQLEIRMQIARMSRLRRGSAKSKDARADKAANMIVALETTWSTLNRRVTEAQERYNTLDNRLYRAQLALMTKREGDTGQVTVIDAAYLPKRPHGGGRKKIVLLGGAVSAFFAMALVFGLALIDERVYNAMDAERLQIGEVLAVVPMQQRGLIARRLARWRIRRQRRS